MDQYFHKAFQVAEYVLPKFEVTVDAQAHATFKDSHLVATVHAKYDVFLSELFYIYITYWPGAG
jgi:hypothetical protein